MAVLSHNNMGTNLWTVLLFVSAMTSATSLDLSSLMANPFGGKAQEVSSTPTPEDAYGQTSVHNKPGHFQQPHKDLFNHQFAGVDPLKLNKFDSLKQDGKFDQLKGTDKLNKFDQDKDKIFNHNKNGTVYSPISVASPVEYPTYSTYDQPLSPPIIDDGSYSSPLYGPQYSPQYRPSFRVPNRGPAHRPYAPVNRQPPVGPIYGPPPMRPPASQYGNSPYEPPNRPQYGNAPIYGGQQPYGGNSGSFGPPVIVPQDAGYHEVPPPYQGPSLDNHHGNSYGQSYAPAVDYSKYVSPVPYSEVSEYMSPAQYNDYTGMLYSAYNLSPPGRQQYTSNYTSQRTNYNNNYDNSFKMIVAVVVLSGYNDYKYKAKTSFKDQNIQKDEINNIQGTLFISEIYPYVCLVSGVVTGMPPNHKFGVAIHTYGDVTNDCHSIGDHYNPTNRTHGNINAPQSHVGDLGNLKSDLAGVAFVNKISRNQFSIQSRNPVAGRSIGICDKEDDLGLGGSIVSLRNGSCGNVMACGIIGLANTALPASNSGHH